MAATVLGLVVPKSGQLRTKPGYCLWRVWGYVGRGMGHAKAKCYLFERILESLNLEPRQSILMEN